jgi:hypothetical protein
MTSRINRSIAALNRVTRKNAERRNAGYVYSLHTCDDIDVLIALAAGSGTAKTAKLAECEASQSGAASQRNAQGSVR